VECEAYRRFLSAIKPGDVVFDVGAHLGTYSILAAQAVGPHGTVVAFEPTPETRELLLRHLEWNGVADRVRVRPVCCSSEPGTVTFFVGADHVEAQNSLIPKEGFSRLEVEANTIDRESSALELIPTLIKMDVEGAEFAALTGAREILETRHPKLLLSIHPNRLPPGINEDILLEMLRELGYLTEIFARDHEIHVWAEPR
jgi:FkbM family methyltransferase